MPYGSARIRMFYGAGDYGRALALRQAYTGGYYAAGGFFSKLGKLAGKAAGLVSKVAPVARFVPGLGTALSAVELARKVLPGPLGKGPVDLIAPLARFGAKQAKTIFGSTGKNLAGAGFGAALGMSKPAVVAGGALLPSMDVERDTRKRRRRSPSRRRRAPERRRRTSSRRRRRAYSQGDYGDDWSGNTPSRAKGSGRFLTRRGGRRRRRRGRGGGRRVSFTTKDGRRVSFTPRR